MELATAAFLLLSKITELYAAAAASNISKSRDGKVNSPSFPVIRRKLSRDLLAV